MKAFLILALLAVAATMATANVQLDPIFQEQQQYPEQQLTSWQQQPFPQLLQQQLNPCRQFLVQQCSPVAVVPFLRSQILQQSSCQVMRQQCCRKLAQIPEQIRCPAIHSIVHAIIMQQQQQQWFLQPQAQQKWFLQPQAQQQWFLQPQAQQQWFLQPWAQQQQWFFNPQAQQQQWFLQPQAQQVSQGIYQPQQQGQIEGLRAFALQALPAMCDVYVPPHCFVSITSSGSI